MIKKLLFVFGISILIPFSVQGQKAKLNQSLEPGAKALQFQITDDVTLDSFSGTLLSFKWQRTQYKAYRAGIGFGGSYAVQTRDFGGQEFDDSSGRLNLSLNFSWLNYVNPQDDVKFYYGYGPEFGIGYNHTNAEDEFSDEERTSTTLSVGAKGYAGVEWFFQKSMSIHAEYQASADFYHFNLKNEENQATDSKDTINGFNLGGDGVVLGLSVYF